MVYDEEKDFFRFRDGRFAFSREHADWTLLRKRGRINRHTKDNAVHRKKNRLPRGVAGAQYGMSYSTLPHSRAD